MTANRGNQGWNIRCAPNRFSDEFGDDEVVDHVPRSFRRLGIEVRVLSDGDLAPPGDTLRDCFDKDDPTVMSHTEAGFKGRLQPHVDLAQNDLFYLHIFAFARSV